VRTLPEERARFERAGRPWGLLFLAEQRRLLRKDYRLRVVVADLEPLLDRGTEVTDEARCIEEESRRLLGIARQRAEAGLSAPQRRWLSAMKMSANSGAFFATSGRPNLSAASRLLDRDRSSAQRAFAEIQERFARERRRLGA
jgi:hypothetical protein